MLGQRSLSPANLQAAGSPCGLDSGQQRFRQIYPSACILTQKFHSGLAAASPGLRCAESLRLDHLIVSQNNLMSFISRMFFSFVFCFASSAGMHLSTDMNNEMKCYFKKCKNCLFLHPRVCMYIKKDDFIIL